MSKENGDSKMSKAKSEKDEVMEKVARIQKSFLDGTMPADKKAALIKWLNSEPK